MDRNKSEGDPVVVGPAVLQGIEAVRETGLTNMLDRLEVARIAHAFGHYAARAWIEANPTAYAEGIFRGFVATSFWDAPMGGFDEDCDCGCGGMRR